MNKIDFLKICKATAEILNYGAPNFDNPNVLEFWWGEFKSYSYEDVKNAFSEAIRTQRMFPVIKDIREILDGPTLTRDDTASKIAATIWGCLSKHGSSFPDRAEQEIGAAGWRVVQQNGGWLNLCNTITDDQRTYMINTWTRQAKAALGDFGVLESGHEALPAQKNNYSTKLVSDLAKNTLKLAE